MNLKLPLFLSGIKFTIGMGIAAVITFVILQLECENSKLRQRINGMDTTRVAVEVHPPSVVNRPADSTHITGGHVKKDTSGVVHHYPSGTFKINERLFSLTGHYDILATPDGRDSMALRYDVNYLKWKLILRFGDRYDLRKGFKIDTDPVGLLGDVAVDWDGYVPTKKPRSFSFEGGGGVMGSKPFLVGGLRIKKYTFLYLQGTDTKGFFILRSF